ncbi:RRXRR domain-containing protein [Acetohalobium arabaticum]|uniref:RRXRR domain-containing protein n=1 Tax=Acetohalobium arabaticum TaxID=28187 RepID=UPI0024792537|nr:RRXRR domain-containing protein [Acetohalobium arabaticum]
MNYAFVLDNEGKMLDPTKTKKAWYLIRQGKAELVEEYPLIIQLNRTVPSSQINDDEIVLGIDDGAKYVGVALGQKVKNPPLFIWVMNLLTYSLI